MLYIFNYEIYWTFSTLSYFKNKPLDELNMSVE